MEFTGLHHGTRRNAGVETRKEVDQGSPWTLVSSRHNKLVDVWTDLEGHIQKSRGLNEDTEIYGFLRHNAKDHGEGLHMEIDNPLQG